MTSSFHAFIHFQPRKLCLAFWAESAVQFTSRRKKRKKTRKRLQVKCLFFSDLKTLNLSTQNVSRYFQEYISRRYVMQTDNYTLQITFWEPKPVNSQASVHSLKSGLTCSLRSRLNTSSRPQHTMRRKDSFITL